MVQLITDIKVQYNILKYKLAKILRVAKSPIPMVIVEHRNGEGKLLYTNAAALLDLGEEHILKSWFQADATATPTVFTLNLGVEASYAETAVLVDVTEVTGKGYVAVSIARDGIDWVASHTGAPWIVTSKNCVFTSTEDPAVAWTIASSLVLSATLGSVDTLIAYAALTAPRTLYPSDTLTVSVVMSLE